MRLDRRCAWAFLAGLVLLFGCGGGGGGASTPAATAPSITTQPTSLTVNAGAAATFTVAASGTAPLGYQWKKDGTALSGVSAASYAVAAAQSGDAGSYTVRPEKVGSDLTRRLPANREFAEADSRLQ